jgi:IS5 family transposase
MGMQTSDFFRSRIDAMINLNDPLAVLAKRLPWDLIEAAVVAKFERQNRAGQSLDGADLFGPTAVVVSPKFRKSSNKFVL